MRRRMLGGVAALLCVVQAAQAAEPGYLVCFDKPCKGWRRIAYLLHPYRGHNGTVHAKLIPAWRMADGRIRLMSGKLDPCDCCVCYDAWIPMRLMGGVNARLDLYPTFEEGQILTLPQSTGVEIESRARAVPMQAPECCDPVRLAPAPPPPVTSESAFRERFQSAIEGIEFHRE